MDTKDTGVQAITKIALFKGNGIRKTLYEGEWWFSVVDVVEALTDSPNPRVYWGVLKDRMGKEEGFQLFTICKQLKLIAEDGKMRETDCADVEGIFRIIQSIPSPKAEPFKRWLAKVGFERIQEIENPELATKRTRMLYKLKGLKRENLRDHMNDLELIFSMLGEAATTEITKIEHPLGFVENKKTAKRGGGVAGLARRKMEKETGKKVVSRGNYLLPKKLN